MGRPTSKTDLLSAAAAGYEEMNQFIASMTEQELATPFAFAETKKSRLFSRNRMRGKLMG